MKIIDLLNKIANGKGVPKYIKYFNKIAKDKLVMMPCKENIIYRLNETAIDLNDEVEILEEEKKIPEKLEFGRSIENGEEILTVPSEKMIIIKINEIIDYLKSKGEE